MAISTVGSGLDVVGRLAGGRGAIVAARAGADDVGVVDRLGRGEGGGSVAILTIAIGRDMRSVLARRGRARCGSSRNCR